MPSPTPDESRDEFVNRCMGDAEAVRDFPENDQRFAVCNALWEQRVRMSRHQGICPPGQHMVNGICVPLSRHQADCPPGQHRVDGMCVSLELGESNIWKVAAEGFKLEVDPNTYLVQNTTELKFEVEGQLYAPIIESEKEVKLQEVVIQNQKLLVVTGIPITPGIHRGFTFSPKVIAEAAQMWLGAPMLENHRIDDASSTKGRVFKVAFEGADILTSGLITDPDTADKVRSGELHSFSSHILVDVNSQKIITKIKKVVELTMTQIPEDKRSVIINNQDVEVNLPLQERDNENGVEMKQVKLAEKLASALNEIIDGKVTETRSRADIVDGMAGAAGIDDNTVNRILQGRIDCPPLNRLSAFASNLGVSLGRLRSAAEADGCSFNEADEADTKLEEDCGCGKKENQNPPPVAEEIKTIGGHKMEEPTEQPATETSVAMEDRVVELEAQNKELVMTLQNVVLEQKVKSAQDDADAWVKSEKISPAQLEMTQKLLVTFSEEQRKMFEEFIGNNAVALEKGTLGMVPTKPPTGPDYSNMSDSEVELRALAEQNAKVEASMFPGEGQAVDLNGFLTPPRSRHGGE